VLSSLILGCQDTFNNAVARGQAAGKKVVVAGCVPQGGPNGRVTKGMSIVGVQQIDRVVEVVNLPTAL
jgi:threonylcarbamoyladenosine tRNA methylthiotransferase CDKAL1